MAALSDPDAIERRRARQREYYARNREARCAAVREYKRLNPEKTAAAVAACWERNRLTYRAREMEWRAQPEIRERLCEQKRAYHQRPEVKARSAEYIRRPDQIIAYRLRSAINKRIRKGGDWQKKTRDLLGYSAAELVPHLERQFLPGMSWENAGAWHIDHIIPLSSFRITGPDDPAIRQAWALSNLRPLWRADNLKKHARVLHLL